jgi:hypothetical protein
MTPLGVVLSVAALVVGLLLGYFASWATPKPAPDDYADCLIHPETTPEVKWVKMTKPTRDTLLEVYAENMDECSRYMQECDRVTIGEAAIMWLMEKAK